MGKTATIAQYLLGTMQGPGSAQRAYREYVTLGVSCNGQVYSVNLNNFINIIVTCGGGTSNNTCVCNYIANCNCAYPY